MKPILHILFVFIAAPGFCQLLPPNLEVPAGNKLFLHVYAKGVQIYRCVRNPTDTARFSWAFVAPQANLYARSNYHRMVGTHYAGPIWESTDHHKIVGRKLQQADAPDSNAIPWLLLHSVSAPDSDSGSGVLTGTTYIQRLNTNGGKAPASMADRAHLGLEARIPYTAEYLFYRQDAPGMTQQNDLQKDLNIFHITSANTSFPDTGRTAGHLYNNILYDAASHYTDNTVLIVVPKNIDIKKKVDLLFWFHGWNNNIDTALVFYKLASQFAASRLNAILVLAETAKNSPDSYGGKLENPGVFKALVQDVLKTLTAEKICKKCRPGNILLAGHSGAYRVMAAILQNGNLPIRESILFDALYADTDKFMNWIKTDPDHRFIDLYTDHGGTDGETRNMMNRLAKENIPYDSLEEAALTPGILKGNRLLFIHSLHPHNDIINNPDNFLLFLQNTTVFSSKKD